MRTLFYFLSLFIAFQPVSWSYSLQMPAQAQVTKISSAHVMQMQMKETDRHSPRFGMPHCKSLGAGMPHSTDHAVIQAEGGTPPSSDQAGACIGHCYASCSGSASLASAVGHNTAPQYIVGMRFQPLAISYLSHTESLEIRPPLRLYL